MIRTLLKPFSFVPALLLMYMIYSFSAQPGEVSSQLSYKVSYKIVETVDQTLNADMADWEIDTWVYRIHGLVRKLAHMTEYFALAVAVSFPLYVYGVHGIWLMLLAGIICVGFACGDEYHQSFVEGRGPSVRDVAIDSFGVFWGIILVRIVGWTGRKTIFRPRKKKKQKETRKQTHSEQTWQEPQRHAYSGQTWQEPQRHAYSDQAWQEPPIPPVRQQTTVPPSWQPRQSYTAPMPPDGRTQAAQGWQQVQGYAEPAPQSGHTQRAQSWQQTQEYTAFSPQDMQTQAAPDWQPSQCSAEPVLQNEYTQQQAQDLQSDVVRRPHPQAHSQQEPPAQISPSEAPYTQRPNPSFEHGTGQIPDSSQEQNSPENIPYRPYTQSYQYSQVSAQKKTP